MLDPKKTAPKATDSPQAPAPNTTPKEAEKTRVAPTHFGSPADAVSPTDETGILKHSGQEGGTFPPSAETTPETEKASRKAHKEHTPEKSPVKSIADPRAVSRVESMETEHPAETGQSKEGHHHGKVADEE